MLRIRFGRLLCLAATLTAYSWADARIASAHQQTRLHGRTELHDVPYLQKPTSARQRLDLYLPSRESGQVPLVFWIHGGGYNSGDKAVFTPKSFTKFGYAVASVDYRLSSEAAFPAQLQDCKDAMRFLQSRATELGLDTSRVCIFGASAGGQLGLLLAESLALSKDQRPPLRAVADWCAPTNLLTYQAQDSSNLSAERHGRDGFVAKLLDGLPSEKPELARAASPALNVNAALPPILIMHGSNDTVVPLEQSKELYRNLQQAGVKSELKIIRGGTHNLATPETIETVQKFFNFHCGMSTQRNPQDRHPLGILRNLMNED